MPKIALSGVSKLALTYSSLFDRNVNVLYTEMIYGDVCSHISKENELFCSRFLVIPLDTFFLVSREINNLVMCDHGNHKESSQILLKTNMVGL